MKVVEPPGGCHGTHNKTDRYPMGAVGPSASENGKGKRDEAVYQTAKKDLIRLKKKR